MHHSTLLRCLTTLGLTACTTAPGAESQKSLGPEPSGLGMGSHAAPASDEGPRFVAEDSQWCEVWIDARGRALEPTPSLLQAWNLVAERGQATMRYVPASPQTEGDARLRVCGTADCKIEQPKIFEATLGGGPQARSGTVRAGFGVIVPSERGPLVVPVAGVEGSCLVAPEVRSAREGSLVHVTALVHQGDYARYYFHGDYEHSYGRPAYGGCQKVGTSRTDIVIDVETAQLELVLTQASSPTRAEFVEVRLGPRAIELHGCSDVLELAWTNAT
jgi:hypothetical protein